MPEAAPNQASGAIPFTEIPHIIPNRFEEKGVGLL